MASPTLIVKSVILIEDRFHVVAQQSRASSRTWHHPVDCILLEGVSQPGLQEFHARDICHPDDRGRASLMCSGEGFCASLEGA